MVVTFRFSMCFSVLLVYSGESLGCNSKLQFGEWAVQLRVFAFRECEGEGQKGVGNIVIRFCEAKYT